MIKCAFDLKGDNNEVHSEEDTHALARGCCWMYGLWLAGCCQRSARQMRAGLMLGFVPLSSDSDEILISSAISLKTLQYTALTVHSLCLTHTQTHTRVEQWSNLHSGFMRRVCLQYWNMSFNFYIFLTFGILEIFLLAPSKHE